MSSGGAWEVIVEKAMLEVSKYLALTTDPFLPESQTSRWMLDLLDKNTLLDVLEERNCGNLCGMIGCSTLHPREISDVGELVGNTSTETSGDNDSSNDGGNDDGHDAAFRACRRRHCAGTVAAGRFCSVACAKKFCAVFAHVPRLAVAGRAGTVDAVGGLFPNMCVAALQRLAGAESTTVADVREKDGGGAGEMSAQGAAGGSHVCWGGKINAAGTWSVCPRSSGQRTLGIFLMVYDWLITITTARTRAVFAEMCRQSSTSSHIFENVYTASGKYCSFYVKHMHPIRNLCLEMAEQTLKNGCKNRDGVCVENHADDDDLPLVHPQLQEQRLGLFVRHIFSLESTAALSRLLLYEQGTLEHAWCVWESSGLLATLRFPFALPGVFVTSSVTPHMLFFALVMLAALGLCVPVVWEEWTRQNDMCDDEKNSSPFEELLDALAVTVDDVVTCVKVLVLG